MGVYKIGSKGDEVRRIQEKLKALGYYEGPIDGDFGRGTETGRNWRFRR
jgi:N-acetylmuramoyl-L-alanine amidase